MLKVSPHESYPPEEGRYIVGDHHSPVAVVIILNARPEKIPIELEMLIDAGFRSGAALSGTVQTENIGIEKIVCNITANPNIRYLILGGPESAGHLTGDALKALIANGVDARRRIIGTDAPSPNLLNLPTDYIQRFRNQVSLVDLQFQGKPEIIGEAVRACRSSQVVSFLGYALHDPGAYPEPALSGQITWRVKQPWAEPEDEREREAVKRARELMERLRAKQKSNLK